MDNALRQAIRPAVRFMTAWLADAEEYPPSASSSATFQFVSGLSDTEADELFIGSIPLLTNRLLTLLSEATHLEPFDVLHRITADSWSS